MIYAGIGSRETPEHILDKMRDLGLRFGMLGFTLRSGGAAGADSAFEWGCDQLYAPKDIFYATDATAEAIKMASSFHPAWERCSEWAVMLHGRNCQQVLGRYLDDPVDFVVCWTKGGKTTGGTATAIRVAEANRIPVYNLGSTLDHCILASFMEGSAVATPGEFGTTVD